MRTLTPEAAKKIIDLNPKKLATYTNQLGQTVTLVEHPIHGDDVPVYAIIENVVANTHFYDVSDFVTTINNILEPTEYMPVLVNGVIDCDLEVN